jgi:hypothetical protein
MLRILHAYLECTGKWKGMAEEAEFLAEEALELAIAGKWEEAARKSYDLYKLEYSLSWGPFIHAVQSEKEKMMRRRRKENAGQS